MMTKVAGIPGETYSNKLKWKKMFIFEKTVCFRTHLCAQTLTHKNIPQKTSSRIKKLLFQRLQSVSHLSL